MPQLSTLNDRAMVVQVQNYDPESTEARKTFKSGGSFKCVLTLREFCTRGVWIGASRTVQQLGLFQEDGDKRRSKQLKIQKLMSVFNF